MTDERFEELERELADLEPTPLSSQFHGQLQERLATPVKHDAYPSTSSIAGWGWGVGRVSLAALAAAIFVMVVLVWQFDEQPAPFAKGPTQKSDITRLVQPPTLLAFHMAMANGNELDELLESHACKLLPHVPDPLTDGR